VYSSFQLAKKYLYYYRTASNSRGHGMHSPFVFDFILHVLNNKGGYFPPAAIEDLRRQLMEDERVLDLQDLGAGSRDGISTQRTVSQIARTAVKPKRLAQVLYRLARHYQPQTILELGTSLGITTAYFSKAAPVADIVTIEGSPAIAGIARENFQKLDCRNIRLLQGDFDFLLPDAIRSLASIDLAYIDGNHRYEPTINYFRQCLERSGNDTILVFDDIHWSAGMEKAWEEIRTHPSVSYTIDIFFLGFVFFRKAFKVKQNFTIRY
jgi:predicted O-methyltransferase YrrM